MSSEGTPLHGDRGAWNVMDFGAEHARDIMDSTLRRHLPLPGAAGGYARSDGTDWQRVNSIALADLADYSAGFIIVGGAADWEAAAFDWDTLSAGAGADMVHGHGSPAEGGTLGFDILTGDCDLADLADYTQGDLIYGGAADWQDLAHPGAANRVLQSTAAEVSWSANAVTFPTAGAVPVGTGGANQVAYWTGANALAGDAGLLVDAANDMYIVADGGGIGNNVATARLHFDSSAAIDHAYFSDCNVSVSITVAENSHFAVRDITLTSAATFVGIHNQHIKTGGAGGAGDDYYGIWNYIGLDQATIIDNMYALRNQAEIVLGTLDRIWGGAYTASIGGGTVNFDAVGLACTVTLNAGTLTGDAYGAQFVADANAGMTAIGGDIYGLHIQVDDDAGAAGTVYMLYLNERTGVDYGIYQASAGTPAPNYLGGRLAVGDTVGALAQVHVDQAVVDAAIPALILDQADTSEGTINFIASDRGIITGATDSLASVRVEIGGVVHRLALYVDA